MLGIFRHEIGRDPDLQAACCARGPKLVFARRIKRAADIGLAAGALLALAPLLLMVAGMIAYGNGGPILRRVRRFGYGGQIVDVYKFNYSPSRSERRAVSDDHLARVAELLHRTRIEDIPALLNVLAGDMSIVGPKAYPLGIARECRPLAEPMSCRHALKPGLIGLARLLGASSAAECMACDEQYIENWSLGLDIKILLKAVCDQRRD